MNNFIYRRKNLFCEEVPVEEICKKIGTPFYLYSSNQILANFNFLSKKFKGYNILIAYAVKANSNQAILRLLAQRGAGADVVSYGEMLRALKAGIPANKIVFSGVGKTELEISQAIEQRILQFNIESYQEFLTIEEIAREKNIKANIAIRINPDVAAGGHPKISTGKKTDKFGVSPEEAIKIYIAAKQCFYLNIVGVDMHIGSQILKIKPFESSFKKIEKFCKKLEKYEIKIKNIDLGGGLGVNYSSKKIKEITNEYTKLVREISVRTKKKIIIEPGRFLVANAGILVTKVLYKKYNDDKKFIIVDSGMNDFLRPALYDAKHVVRQLKLESKKKYEDYFDIVGPICETADVIMENALLSKNIDRGDYLFVEKAGAYGSTMSSTYNSRSLISEVLVSKKNFFEVRKKMKENDFLKLEKVPSWIK